VVYNVEEHFSDDSSPIALSGAAEGEAAGMSPAAYALRAAIGDQHRFELVSLLARFIGRLVTNGVLGVFLLNPYPSCVQLRNLRGADRAIALAILARFPDATMTVEQFSVVAEDTGKKGKDERRQMSAVGKDIVPAEVPTGGGDDLFKKIYVPLFEWDDLDRIDFRVTPLPFESAFFLPVSESTIKELPSERNHGWYVGNGPSAVVYSYKPMTLVVRLNAPSPHAGAPS
jgi:hypothetical protein